MFQIADQESVPAQIDRRRPDVGSQHASKPLLTREGGLVSVANVHPRPFPVAKSNHSRVARTASATARDSLSERRQAAWKPEDSPVPAPGAGSGRERRLFRGRRGWSEEQQQMQMTGGKGADVGLQLGVGFQAEGVDAAMSPVSVCRRE